MIIYVSRSSKRSGRQGKSHPPRFEQKNRRKAGCGIDHGFYKGSLCHSGWRRLNLSRRELALLKIMVSHPNQVFKRSDLIDMIQGQKF